MERELLKEGELVGIFDDITSENPYLAKVIGNDPDTPDKVIIGVISASGRLRPRKVDPQQLFRVSEETHPRTIKLREEHLERMRIHQLEVEATNPDLRTTIEGELLKEGELVGVFANPNSIYAQQATVVRNDPDTSKVIIAVRTSIPELPIMLAVEIDQLFRVGEELTPRAKKIKYAHQEKARINQLGTGQTVPNLRTATKDDTATVGNAYKTHNDFQFSPEAIYYAFKLMNVIPIGRGVLNMKKLVSTAIQDLLRENGQEAVTQGLAATSITTFNSRVRQKDIDDVTCILEFFDQLMQEEFKNDPSLMLTLGAKVTLDTLGTTAHEALKVYNVVSNIADTALETAVNACLTTISNSVESRVRLPVFGSFTSVLDFMITHVNLAGHSGLRMHLETSDTPEIKRFAQALAADNERRRHDTDPIVGLVKSTGPPDPKLTNPDRNAQMMKYLFVRMLYLKQKELKARQATTQESPPDLARENFRTIPREREEVSMSRSASLPGNLSDYRVSSDQEERLEDFTHSMVSRTRDSKISSGSKPSSKRHRRTSSSTNELSVSSDAADSEQVQYKRSSASKDDIAIAALTRQESEEDVIPISFAPETPEGSEETLSIGARLFSYLFGSRTETSQNRDKDRLKKYAVSQDSNERLDSFIRGRQRAQQEKIDLQRQKTQEERKHSVDFSKFRISPENEEKFKKAKEKASKIERKQKKEEKKKKGRGRKP